MYKVNFFTIDVDDSFLKKKRKLRKSIFKLFEVEKKLLQSLNYIFCNDEYLLKINNDYLKHDWYTDVITFDLSEGETINGEIYISIPRIEDNARQLNVLFQQELLRVIFHGALHLCGYKDKTKSEITAMRGKEELYLNTYFKFVT